LALCEEGAAKEVKTVGGGKKEGTRCPEHDSALQYKEKRKKREHLFSYLRERERKTKPKRVLQRERKKKEKEWETTQYDR